MSLDLWDGSGNCPCDRCNGRLTGAWEDEQTNDPRDWDPEPEKDPYEGLCLACGVDFVKEDGSEHTMAECPAPWYWSAYEGADREEKIREDQERTKRENQEFYRREFGE